MTKPRQPKDQPPPETVSDADPPGHASRGVPDGADDAEPTGLPNSDRHITESATKEHTPDVQR